MSKKALFITIEGGEGSGKTSLIASLQQKLAQNGHTVVVTREPGGTLLGNQIRELLLNQNPNLPISSMAELLLFLAARAQNLNEVIIPALNDGKIVICDRFNDSTVAYQGVARGMGFHFVQELCLAICNKVLPDATLFLDVDPKIGLERTRLAHKENANSGTIDRIEAEKLGFHEKVRSGMHKLAAENADRIRVIDGSLSMQEVLSEALQVINSKLD